MDVNKLSLRKSGAGGGVRVQLAAMAALLSQSFLRGPTWSLVWTKSQRCIYRPDMNSSCHFQTECGAPPGAASSLLEPTLERPDAQAAVHSCIWESQEPPVWPNPGSDQFLEVKLANFKYMGPQDGEERV